MLMVLVVGISTVELLVSYTVCYHGEWCISHWMFKWNFFICMGLSHVLLCCGGCCQPIHRCKDQQPQLLVRVAAVFRRKNGYTLLVMRREVLVVFRSRDLTEVSECTTAQHSTTHAWHAAAHPVWSLCCFYIARQPRMCPLPYM